MKKIGIASLLVLVFFLIACAAPQTKTQKGATYGAAGGAAAGAIIGQVIGGHTESTLWGAAIGAAVGGLGGAGIGKMMDNQEREMRDALSASEAAAVSREGNLLAVTFKGDVTFDTNSTVVNPGLYTEFDRVAGILTRYPETLIRVEGHTVRPTTSFPTELTSVPVTRLVWPAVMFTAVYVWQAVNEARESGEFTGWEQSGTLWKLEVT
ncbi:MAG: glycine zipper domain-containing protein [Desulfobacterales bacterium]